ELERFEERLDAVEHSSDTIPGFASRLQPSTFLTERDSHAWRTLVEELEAVAVIIDRPGFRRAPAAFAEFRKITSGIAGLRTVDRLAPTAAVPGLPRVRIMSPHSLGYRE